MILSIAGALIFGAVAGYLMGFAFGQRHTVRRVAAVFLRTRRYAAQNDMASVVELPGMERMYGVISSGDDLRGFRNL